MTLSNTLTVQGATTLSQTLGVTGVTTLSNTLTVSGNSPTTLGGTLSLSNTLSTNLITACNISTNSISNNFAFASVLSSVFLDVKSGNISSLRFYDGATTSSGTFRYSTLVSMTLLAPTSLLYFNNFVVAGAYVWPGQIISN